MLRPTGHHSALQALAISHGLSDHQKKNIIPIVPTKFSTRAGGAGQFGMGFVGASSLNLYSFLAEQSWVQRPMPQLLWNLI